MEKINEHARNVARKMGILYQGMDYGQYVFVEGTVGCLWVHKFNTPKDFYSFLFSRLNDSKITSALESLKR